jgi:tRNA1(Val) A37 N6-methylase TrmN6
VLIHRADRLGQCLAGIGARAGGVQLRLVHPEADRPAIRLLLAALKGSRAPLSVLPPVILNGPDGCFTPLADALHRGDAVLA